MMENISYNNNSCNSKTPIQGCADGVPYLMLVSDGCCEEETLKYINLNTGVISYDRPLNFELGECSDADRIDSNICFEFVVNNVTIPIRVATVNGIVTYYENEIQVTDAIRIAEIETLLASATSSNVVCCPCGVELPPYRTCYSVTEPRTVTAWNFGPRIGVTKTLAASRELNRIEVVVNDGTGNNVCKDIVFAEPIQYWTSTGEVSAAIIEQKLKAALYLEKVKECIPCLDNMAVYWQDNGTTVRELVIRLWCSDGSGDSLINGHYARYYRSQDGVLIGDTDIFSQSVTWTYDYANKFSVYYINGVTTYFENGVEVTDATRLATLQGWVSGAIESDIVCCDDCLEDEVPKLIDVLPPFQQCYPVATTTTIRKTNWQQVVWYLYSGDTVAFPVGQVVSIAKVISNSQPSVPITPIPIFNGTSFYTVAQIQANIDASNIISVLQQTNPAIDTVKAEINGTELKIRIYDKDNAVISILGNALGYGLSPNPSNQEYVELVTTETFTVTETVNVEYKAVYLDGQTFYYKDGVLLTNLADIAAAKEAINNLDALGCCSDCAGGSDVTVTNTIAGHTIATVTIDGVATDIKETVTSIETNADGSFTYTDENGDAHIIPVTPCKSFYEKQTFTATAGQTTFTLLTAPSGDIHFSRNGSTLNDLAATVSGNVVTYVPNQNNNEALLAGDRIDISYVYTICTGTATVVDGSETKIIGCAGTTVTGAGTIANPYVICATGTTPDGSETKLVAGTGVTITGTGTTANPYVVTATGSAVGIGNFGTLTSNSGQAVSGGVTLDMIAAPANQTYGTLVVPDPATNTLLLKAGYIYEVDAELQMAFSSSGTWFNYAIFSGTTAASQTTQVGNPGKIRPQTEPANARYDTNASAFIVATADTYVSLKGTNGNGTTNNFENATYFKAKVIGKI